MGMYASVNGVVTEAAVARVSVLDNGFTFGDAVYETLRTSGGRPFHLDRHLLRHRQSAAGLRIALPLADGELRTRASALLAASGNEESYLRIIVSMYLTDPEPGDADQPRVRVPLSAGVGLTLTLAFTVVVGFLPWWLVDYARDAVPSILSSAGP